MTDSCSTEHNFDLPADMATVFHRSGYTLHHLQISLKDMFAAYQNGHREVLKWHLDRDVHQSDTADGGLTQKLTMILQWVVIHEGLSSDDLVDLFGEKIATQLFSSDLVAHDVDGFHRLLVDIRPHVTKDGQPVYIVSDIDPAFVPDELLPLRPVGHLVPGVGAASWNLHKAVPVTRAGRVLDLGTGSGYQAVTKLGTCTKLVATDISERALLMARLTVSLSQALQEESRPRGEGRRHRTPPTHVDLRCGSWWEPVEGEKFDQIIANPPFVISPAKPGATGEVYRDSGLLLDGASRITVEGLKDHLAEDGVATVMASWIITASNPGEPVDWRRRPVSWIPDEGIAAWIIQRDHVDPITYAETWLIDGGIDPKSPAGQKQLADWVRWFDDQGVLAIGMGIIACLRISDTLPSDVLAEEITSTLENPLGKEISDYFTRTRWLAQHTDQQLASSHYMVSPTVALERIETPVQDPFQGFQPAALRITRTDMHSFCHDIDEPLAAIISGLNPDGLTLYDTVDLYCTVRGLATERILPDVTAAIVDLVRHGIILPADLVTI